MANLKDRDIKTQEEKLAEIERRATEMRAQLETRRKSKDETLKLLMTIVENPSRGAGLPDHWMRLLLTQQHSMRASQEPSYWPSRFVPNVSNRDDREAIEASYTSIDDFDQP